MHRKEVPCSRHSHGVTISRQGDQRGDVTGVVLRRPQAVRRNFQRRKPHPFRVRRAMTVPIKPWVIHENGESAADQQQQKEEVHKMSQSQPSGETVRVWWIFQIDRRQERFRWKPGDQILSPGNRHWSKSEDGKDKNEPRIYPNPETTVRWVVDRSMDFVECLHKESGSSVDQLFLAWPRACDRGFLRGAPQGLGRICDRRAPNFGESSQSMNLPASWTQDVLGSD